MSTKTFDPALDIIHRRERILLNLLRQFEEYEKVLDANYRSIGVWGDECPSPHEVKDFMAICKAALRQESTNV